MPSNISRRPLTDEEVARREREAEERQRIREIAAQIVALVRECDLTTAQILHAVDHGDGRPRRAENRTTRAALRSLSRRQLIHRSGKPRTRWRDDDRWSYGPPAERRLRPLTIRGACERCGELHIGPCR